MLFVADTDPFGLVTPFRVIALALTAFVLTYLVTRFALVGLTNWATASESDSLASHVGPPAAKILAFSNALTVASGVASLDLPLVWSYGASVVFVLAVVVYRFERLLEGRQRTPK